MIKIITGTAEEFEKQTNKLSEKGFEIMADTYRVLEYYGKILYSAVVFKENHELNKI